MRRPLTAPLPSDHLVTPTTRATWTCPGLRYPEPTLPSTVAAPAGHLTSMADINSDRHQQRPAVVDVSSSLVGECLCLLGVMANCKAEELGADTQ